MAHILVIEDNPSNFKLFEAILKSAGHEVLWAEDGEKGLSLVPGGQVELILLDLRLPSMDGFEVAKRLKENEQSSQIPVLVVSAQAMQEDIQRALKLGVDGYITKPIRYKELLETMNRFLK